MGISPKVIRELFAVSGNLCALCLHEKNYPQLLVDGEHNSINEIAHIRSGKIDGPRYDPNYKDVDGVENLIPLCNNCHEKIDKKDNLQKYSVEFLCELKKKHEAKFTKIIRDLATVADVTKLNQPIYPKNLKKLIVGDDDQDLLLKDFRNFLDKLKSLTADCRTFLKVCLERSKNSCSSGCYVLEEEINQVLGSAFKVKKLYDVCENNGLVDYEKDEGKGYFYLYFNTDSGFDIFNDLKHFSKKNNINLGEFFDELDFSSLDD